MSITGPASLDARFPGQWFQLEAGLNYNWHRHYDPTLGRYTQPDPLGFVDGPSVYGYAGGSPQQAVDVDGRRMARHPKNIPAEKYHQCARACLDEYYGLSLSTGVSAALATPIPKRLVGLPETIGSSKVTNPISLAGLGIKKMKRSRLGTKRPAGIIGRANVGLATGLLLVDSIALNACTKSCAEDEPEDQQCHHPIAN